MELIRYTYLTVCWQQNFWPLMAMVLFSFFDLLFRKSYNPASWSKYYRNVLRIINGSFVFFIRKAIKIRQNYKFLLIISVNK